MANMRLFLTLMSRDNADKIMGFLINKGFQVKASAGRGAAIHGDNDSLSHIMVLDINVSNELETKILKEEKLEDKKTDASTMPQAIGIALKKYLCENNINYFSHVVQCIGQDGASWNSGNVKKANAKDIRKLRQEEKGEEE